MSVFRQLGLGRPLEFPGHAEVKENRSGGGGGFRVGEGDIPLFSPRRNGLGVWVFRRRDFSLFSPRRNGLGFRVFHFFQEDFHLFSAGNGVDAISRPIPRHIRVLQADFGFDDGAGKEMAMADVAHESSRQMELRTFRHASGSLGIDILTSDRGKEALSLKYKNLGNDGNEYVDERSINGNH